MVTQRVSIAFINVSSSLFGITAAACHRVHLSNMWKMMCFPTNNRSHSTWWLNVSAISTLLALLGPGFIHSRQTLQVCTISGMRSNTLSATPTRSRNRRMVVSEACHHRTCSFRNVSRMALSFGVRKSLTTRPMSKSVQLCGFSGLSPASRNERRTLCSASGPRPRRSGRGSSCGSGLGTGSRTNLPFRITCLVTMRPPGKSSGSSAASAPWPPPPAASAPWPLPPLPPAAAGPPPSSRIRSR